MTIEEKAKAYDETVDKLKILKWAHRFSPVSDTIDELFPELAVSKDEKIRKSLIEGFEQYDPDEYWRDIVPVKDILEWLKKQEQIPVDTEDRDLWEYINVRRFGRLPGDLDELSVCVDYVIKRHCKQPEWSKKDEEILAECISAITYARCEHGEDNDLEHDPSILWLKSLSPWKQDDKDIDFINDLISHFNNLAINGSVDKERYETYVIPKLKSYLPRPHWRPTKEQIEAVDNASFLIEQQVDADYPKTIEALNKLSVDLKKL